MSDQERCDEIDRLKQEVTNLTAGLNADGKPDKPPKSSSSSDND